MISILQRIYGNAPVQRMYSCAGAVVLCGLLLACDRSAGRAGGDRTRELTSDTIQLPAGTTLHDVQVKATADSDFTPARVSARAGDVVRFTIRDTRTHALILTGPTEAANAVLTTMVQRRSPPLVSAGQSWVLSLKGLPAGTYNVSCASHAGTAAIIVQ